MSAGHTTPQESTPIFPPGRRLALVIGTNGQPAPARAPLHYAVNDAIDMAHVLQQKYCGFELVCPPLLGAQASSDQIRAAVIELARQLQKDDLALFFFSGHAEALPTGADLDEVYLVSNTFDAGDIAIDCDAHISLRWLRQVLFEHKKAGSVLLILDCCYAGKFADSAPDLYLQTLQHRLKSYFGEPGAASPSRPGGIRLALTATGASAAKEQDGHGVLTGHLLAALKGEREQIADEQGQITFGRLFDHLAQALPAEQPDQHPWHFGAGAGLVLAMHLELSQERRRERKRAARHAEARLRLRELISRQHDGFLQDRLKSFVGRQQELKEIRRKIEELLPTGGYLTITGQAGQGKSSIIARLVEDSAQEQGGRERVAYHFIPLNPAPDYQVALLRNLMARLVLKYDLSDLFLAGESRAALSESFPEVLQKIAERGGQEIIFVDGLDQLQLDQQTGLRDLSFLPQGPGNPPPGVVFVLGTRPNDTLRPLALLKPHEPYHLPAMSREDFDAILRHRHVTLDDNLAERFYETLEHNALYLDLVAKELAARPHIDHQEVEEIVRQLADNPDNLFSLSLERLSFQDKLWEAVIKPVLGLLLAASEPLSREMLKCLLNLTRDPDSDRWVDGEQLDRGLASLGGLVIADEQQRYSLYHLKFREYLRQDVQRPQKRPLFDREDEQRWHRRFVAWCEQGGLERIWPECSDAIEQGRRCYARQHYITHLFHAEEGDWNKLFSVLDEGAYGKAKVWDDLSMRAYTLDLDLGRQAAAWPDWSQQEAIDHLPHLWRYTWLRCSLTSRADRYPRKEFEVMLLLREEAKALGLAELLTKPEYKAEIFMLIAAHLLKQSGREREALHLFSRAERVIGALPEGWGKAAALRELAGALAQAGQEQQARRLWQEAERLIGALPEDDDKADALSKLAGTLAQAGQWQQARRLWQEAERLIGALPEDDDKAAALCELAGALAQAGQEQQARRLWQEAERLIASLPKGLHKAEALRALAAALAQAERWQEAERLIASITYVQPYAAALRELAGALARAGQEQEARRCWQEAERVTGSLTDNWHKVEALSALAGALAWAGQRQEAERVIASLPENWRKAAALRDLAGALAQAGQEQQARRLYQEAERLIASLPDNPPKAIALRELAVALAQAGLWQEAERLIASITEDDDKAAALRELAVALAQAGLWQEAERLIASLTDDWRKAAALSALAGVLAQTGQRQEAERLIASLPENWHKAAALSELAGALAQAGQEQEAERVIASITDNWHKAEALRALAAALAQAGQEQQARHLWQEAERLIGSLPKGLHKAAALSELAGALAQAGQEQQARRLWQEAERLIASLPENWHKAEALRELAGALAQAERWQEAERLIASLTDDWRKARALRDLAEALARHNEYHRLISLVQRWWLRATRRDDALELLPIAFGLIPRFPELGMALFEAFRWVDEFLRGERGSHR